MLIAPIPTAGPTPGNLWCAPLRSAKHAASNVSAEPGLAPVHSASTDSSTRSAPTAATRLTTAQGLVKWPSRFLLALTPCYHPNIQRIHPKPTFLTKLANFVKHPELIIDWQ